MLSLAGVRFLLAGGRDYFVHSGVFDHLAVVVERVGGEFYQRIGSYSFRFCIERVYCFLQQVGAGGCRDRFVGVGESVLHVLQDLIFGLRILRPLFSFGWGGFSEQGRRDYVQDTCNVFRLLAEGSYTFEGADGWSEIEFIRGHGGHERYEFLLDTAETLVEDFVRFCACFRRGSGRCGSRGLIAGHCEQAEGDGYQKPLCHRFSLLHIDKAE